MANPDRSSYFPAIEKKHGQPMSYWFDVMSEMGDRKYPEQMAYLQENHGFSRAHANALVLYCKGSTSAHRHSSVEDYFSKLPAEQQETMREIFAVITSKFPKTEVVVAWNQPMVKLGKDYLFGASASKSHLTIAPHSNDIVQEFLPRLEGYHVNKKTIRVPSDWKVDKKLLTDLVKARLKEIDQ